MAQDNLFINTLSFDYPEDKLTFHFSMEDNNDAHYTRIYRTNFPTDIKKVLPELSDDTEFIYTTFTYPVANLATLDIDLKTENKNFVKQYYNDQIRYFFKKNNQSHKSALERVLIKQTFIKDNQIRIRLKKEDSPRYFVYEKYSLKINFAHLTNNPELTISYDGRSKLIKENVMQLIQDGAPPTALKRVLNYTNPKNAYLCHYDSLIEKEDDKVDYEKVFPVLNYELVTLLNIELPEPQKTNRYVVYENKIRGFVRKYINNQFFLKLFPLHNNADFLSVPEKFIGHTSEESNLLAFGNGETDIVPHNGVKQYGPYKRPVESNIRYFFIYHTDDEANKNLLCDFFKDGRKYFRGLSKYAKIPFFEDSNANIIFTNKENPLDEIKTTLLNRQNNDDYKSIAIYLTPYSKDKSTKPQKEIYYKVKEILLKYHITSQCIDTEKMNIQLETETFWLSLNNIAIAILAKLGGIPWRIKTNTKNELIVGIGAFTHVDTQTKYIASAFSFQNTGLFNRFEYFVKDETKALAGSIESAIKDYTSINKNIDRLIIHFYKEMSEKEFEPIEKILYNLHLDIPVFVVAINKTESEDYVIFDNDFKHRMPHSGTYVNISENTYLLCNNTRYNDSFKLTDGTPFPVKLKIDCSDKSLLQDIKTVKELIDQVYQFSRIYWKSVKQQNLPVTIKYPEMVAQIAPHFDGSDIPDAGKDSLWFL